MDDSGVNSCAFQVFIAKYGYDPVSLSPNDNPDAELAFSAGDYLFIYGDVDEDGFYEGELMDGKKGLVPSNFIEKVPDDDLKDLDKTVGNGIDFTPIIDFPTIDSPEQPIITEIIDRSFAVPPPKDLHMERQLSCSYVVAWFSPEESILQAEGIDIECYQVYCNDQLMCTIYRGDRTKALLEKLDTTKSHRVSLRAVATDGRTSCDQLCTITIGKSARLAPSAVEVIEIAKRSAVVQWCLASSYLQHRVSVDDQWDHILPPGVFKCQISGLLPNSSHTICISCIQNTSDDRSFVSSSISFVTLPKDFPDPPTDVMADIGPQRGTILVTWTPAFKDSLESTRPRKTNITGYNIYIDGHKIKQLHSPTSDHIVLSWKNYDFQEGVNNMLTIRTVTDRLESPDSSPATVLSNVLIEEVIRVKSQMFDNKINMDEKRVTINEIVSKNEGISIINDIKKIKHPSIYYGDAGKTSALPQIEITRDSLSDSSFDNHVNQEPIRSPVKLKDKKVQTSPRLMKSSMRENDDVKVATIKRRDIGVGCDETTLIATSLKTTKVASTTDGIRNIEDESVVGSDIEKVVANKVRLFVGLFDYNPISMSPNQDFSSEELQFCEGQLLKVFGEKDADGFYTGESNGIRGLIPSNMVTEVLVYNPLTAEQLLKDNLTLCRNKSLSLKSSRPVASKQPPVLGRQATLGSNRPRRMVAIYNYNPNKNLSNVDSEYELNLKPGDRVVIFGEPDVDGFVRAEIGQRKGLVPINYLRPATPIPRPQNPQGHPADLKPRPRGQRDDGGRRPSGSRMLPSHIPGQRRMPPDVNRHSRSGVPSQNPSASQSVQNNEQLLSERETMPIQLDQQMDQQSLYAQ